MDADVYNVMHQLCNSADCPGLTCNSGAVACQTLTASVGAGNEERGAGCGFGAASPCAASTHRFNDKLYTSPLAQREPSIDRQGTRCAAPCCQELVMLTKEVAGGWSWRYRQASGFTCADRNINPAPARKLQRDRQNILLRDVAICAHHVAQCHRGPCTTSARLFRRKHFGPEPDFFQLQDSKTGYRDRHWIPSLFEFQIPTSRGYAACQGRK